MQKIDIGLGTFVAASTLADRFNLVAGVAGRHKVARTVEQAIDFIDSTLPKMADGWQLTTGNPYDWGMPVLDKTLGNDIGSKEIAGDDAGSIAISISDLSYGKAVSIRQVFNLKSEQEVLRLAVAIYSRLRDGVWRGNSFSYEKNGQLEYLDTKPYSPKP